MTFKDLKFETESMTYFGSITRAHVEFPNGNGLSVVDGTFTYSGGGTYEIGPLHNGSLFIVDDWCDSVKGYVRPETIDKILEYAENHTFEEYKNFLNDIDR